MKGKFSMVKYLVFMMVMIPGLILAQPELYRLVQTKLCCIFQSHNGNAAAKQVYGLRIRLADGTTIPLPYNQPAQQISIGSGMLMPFARTLAYSVEEGLISGYNTLTVPPVLDYRVNLSDGTEIWLNACSSLQFPFTFITSIRSINLAGEAFFNVKKTGQLFVVRGPGWELRTKEALFNINAYTEGTTTISVIKGMVIFSSLKSGPLQLIAGEQATFADLGKYPVTPFDADSVLSWRNGILDIEDTKLKDITPVLQRWFDVVIAFDDPELEHRAVTGTICKHKPLQTFLQNFNGMIDSYSRNDTLHLKYP
jgi:transmembrane sensor